MDQLLKMGFSDAQWSSMGKKRIGILFELAEFQTEPFQKENKKRAPWATGGCLGTEILRMGFVLK